MSKNDLNNDDDDDDIENTILAINFFLLQLGKLLFH